MTTDEAPPGQMTAEDWDNPITSKPPRERRPRTKLVAAPIDEDFGEPPATAGGPPGPDPAGSGDHLRNAQRTAEQWIAGVISLLALFGGIAIVAGPVVDKVSSSAVRWTVLAFTALAGIAAMVSLGMATSASHLPIPPETVLRRLLLARVSGFVAATLLFVGGGVLLAADAAPGGPPGSAPSVPSAPSVLVVRKSGQLVCGPIGTAGSAVTVGGRRISDVVSITVVASC